jgi:hypothetical protein
MNTIDIFGSYLEAALQPRIAELALAKLREKYDKLTINFLSHSWGGKRRIISYVQVRVSATDQDDDIEIKEVQEKYNDLYNNIKVEEICKIINKLVTV